MKMRHNMVMIKRSNCDRRSPRDRRVINLGPAYPMPDRRCSYERRQLAWKGRRKGWFRTSRWRSVPVGQITTP